MWISETPNKVEIDMIKIDKSFQGKGIGSQVIKKVQEYAKSINKPLVVAPFAGKGKKTALDKFYKSHGFKYNTGRNKDYSLSSPFRKTMIYRP